MKEIYCPQPARIMTPPGAKCLTVSYHLNKTIIYSTKGKKITPIKKINTVFIKVYPAVKFLSSNSHPPNEIDTPQMI